MIKNDRQYKYTKRKLREFQKDLNAVQKEYAAGNPNKLRLLSQGYREHIEQLSSEIAEYERIKKTPLPRVLKVRGLSELSTQLARLRIGRKITQAQLAIKLGCKQSDISRLEREDYRGYTMNQLEKITESLNANIELNIILGKATHKHTRAHMID